MGKSAAPERIWLGRGRVSGLWVHVAASDQGSTATRDEWHEYVRVDLRALSAEQPAKEAVVRAEARADHNGWVVRIGRELIGHWTIANPEQLAKCYAARVNAQLDGGVLAFGCDKEARKVTEHACHEWCGSESCVMATKADALPSADPRPSESFMFYEPESRKPRDLLPCPFCGGAATLDIYSGRHDKDLWHVACENRPPCRLDLHTDLFDTPDDAAIAWNTRHTELVGVMPACTFPICGCPDGICKRERPSERRVAQFDEWNVALDGVAFVSCTDRRKPTERAE